MVRVSTAYTTTAVLPTSQPWESDLAAGKIGFASSPHGPAAVDPGAAYYSPPERTRLGLLDGRLPSRVNLGIVNANYRPLG